MTPSPGTGGGTGRASEGICIVDKPGGWTSHDVVGRARRLLGTRKVGHAGTLDPMATGVLVLGVGRATRLLTFITGVDKSYEATIRLGVETDSLDADGAVLRRHDMTPPTRAALAAAAGRLTGDLDQVPPMVSAVKVGGRRLHELAREGVEVERSARRVHVERFEVHTTDDPMLLHATVTCSSGTYVRVLAADLGAALGGGAHLASLRRTRVGPFALDEATDLESLRVLPPVEGVRHLEQTELDEATAAAVRHGRVLERGALELAGPGPWALVQDGHLLAIYEAHRAGTVKPSLVMAPATTG